MKRKMKLVPALAAVSFTILAAASSAFAGMSICNVPGAIEDLQKQIDNPENAFSTTSMNTIVNGKKVVLAGDMHYATDQIALAYLMHGFKAIKGSNACIAFEFAKQEGDALTNFKTFLGRRLAVVKMLEEKADATPEEKYRAANLKKNTEQAIKYYGPLFLEAQKLGLKTLLVDSVGFGSKEISMETRNADMAKHIGEALNSGCSSVFFIVGKAHLAHVDEFENNGALVAVRNNVKENLSRLGVDSVTINVQMLTKKWESASLAFPTCEAPTSTKMAFVTTERVDSKALLMPSTGSLSPAWSDYDYTLLAP